MGKKSIILAGKGHITDRLGELSFIISPASFYQVNPVQTLVLYRKALECAGLKTTGDLTVVDAYSGVGTIALFMAGRPGGWWPWRLCPGRWRTPAGTRK